MQSIVIHTSRAAMISNSTQYQRFLVTSHRNVVQVQFASIVPKMHAIFVPTTHHHQKLYRAQHSCTPRAVDKQ